MRAARVVALGHPFGGDDAVGLAVLDALKTAGIEADLHHASDATDLVLLFEDGARVVLVDALVGAGAPGEVRQLTPEQLESGGDALSTHGIAVTQAVALARVLFPENPVELKIVAIAIERPRTPSHGLSPSVANAVPRAVEAVRTLVR